MNFILFISISCFLILLNFEQSNLQPSEYIGINYFHLLGDNSNPQNGWNKRGDNEIQQHEEFIRIFFENDQVSPLNSYRAMHIGSLINSFQLKFLCDINLDFPEPQGSTLLDRGRASIGLVYADNNDWIPQIIFAVYRSNNDLFGILGYNNENNQQVFVDDEILLAQSYNPSRIIEIIVEFDIILGNIAVYAEKQNRFSLNGIQFGSKNIDYVSFGIVQLNEFIGTPGGYIDLYECEILVKKVDEIFVSASDGDDENNDGKSRESPFKTVSKALPYITPGTNVIISEGLYRGESLGGFVSGNPDDPIVFRKENENSKIVFSGSVNAGDFSRTKIPPNDKEVYYLDFSSIKNDIQDTPRFVVQLSDGFSITQRYNISQFPSFVPSKPGKVYDPYVYWFKADGGSSRCPTKLDWKNPVQEGQTSRDYLTYENFYWPNEYESFSFCDSHIDLVGATIIINDGISGHYTYTRKIIEHDSGNCRVRVDRNCFFITNVPALGPSATFLITNKIEFLTQENEVYFDNATKRLYIFAPSSVDWDLIEIQMKNHAAFNLHGISNVIVDGITIMMYNFAFLENGGYGENYRFSHNITVRNCEITHVNTAVRIHRGISFNSTLRNYRFENNQFAYIDSQVFDIIMVYDDLKFDQHDSIGISEFYIIGNRMYHIAFGAMEGDNRDGSIIWDADHFYVTSNIFEKIAHNGLLFIRSHRKSQYVGIVNNPNIVPCCNLVFNNTFDSCCNGNCDCGGLKIYGTLNDDQAVFDRFLVMNNVVINTFGVCFPSYIQGKWSAENNGTISGGGPNKLSGLGGWGFYMDRSAGVTFYRNLAINSGLAGMQFYTVWELGVNIILNNVFVGGKFGVHLGSKTFDFSEFSRTDVMNNIFYTNHRYGLKIDGATETIGFSTPEAGRIFVNNNLYFDVSKFTTIPDEWVNNKGTICVYFEDGSECLHDNVTDTIFEKYPNFNGWEKNGVGVLNPDFLLSTSLIQKLKDPNIFEITREEALEFWVTTQPLVDRGTDELPEELRTLLELFGICDLKNGEYFDVGSRENNFDVGYCGNTNGNGNDSAIILAVVLPLLFLFLCCLFLLICLVVFIAFWGGRKKKEEESFNSDEEKELKSSL